MTDWIKHTTDNCPVDPETVVEVRLRGGYVRPADKAGDMDWGSFWLASARPPLGSPIQHPLDVTHYRIITPAKPQEPEGKEIDPRGTQMWIERQPDLITLRLECLKLAVNDHFYEAGEPDYEKVADRFLHYVLNGSVDKA